MRKRESSPNDLDLDFDLCYQGHTRERERERANERAIFKTKYLTENWPSFAFMWHWYAFNGTRFLRKWNERATRVVFLRNKNWEADMAIKSVASVSIVTRTSMYLRIGRITYGMHKETYIRIDWGSYFNEHIIYIATGNCRLACKIYENIAITKDHSVTTRFAAVMLTIINKRRIATSEYESIVNWNKEEQS